MEEGHYSSYQFHSYSENEVTLCCGSNQEFEFLHMF
jgi:hypothetical protein